GHAAQRGIESLHGLDEIVMLAAEELEPLLQLSVLVVRDQVDGAHALELLAQLFVAKAHRLQITGGVVGSEQRVGTVYGVATSRLLKKLLAAHAALGLLQVELVDARHEAVQGAVSLAQLVLHGLSLIEAAPMLLRQHRPVPLPAIALRPPP